METRRHRDMKTLRQAYGDMETSTWRQEHGNKDMKTSNGKRKPRRFSIICLPFAHHANGSLSFVRLLMNQQTEVILCKRTKRTKRTCPSMAITQKCIVALLLLHCNAHGVDLWLSPYFWTVLKACTGALVSNTISKPSPDTKK
jgi:hypothetical protein